MKSRVARHVIFISLRRRACPRKEVCLFSGRVAFALILPVAFERASQPIADEEADRESADAKSYRVPAKVMTPVERIRNTLFHRIVLVSHCLFNLRNCLRD